MVEFLQTELFSARPISPTISIRGITQTSITIQWDPLRLFRADLVGIEVFRNSQKLNVAPVGTTAKLTGLDVNQMYQIYIRVKTSAGILKSNTLSVNTHSLDNLTGINVSFGDFGSTKADAKVNKLIDLVYKMGATYSEELSPDNTHLVCTVPKGPKVCVAFESLLTSFHSLSAPGSGIYQLFHLRSWMLAILTAGFSRHTLSTSINK